MRIVKEQTITRIHKRHYPHTENHIHHFYTNKRGFLSSNNETISTTYKSTIVQHIFRGNQTNNLGDICQFGQIWWIFSHQSVCDA